MAAPKLDMSRSPQRHFFIGMDSSEENLKRQSIFFAVLLKLNSGVSGRSSNIIIELQVWAVHPIPFAL